jgi:hypothetical protein
MIYAFFVLPVTGLIFSIIGIVKKIKYAWLMCIMWAVSIIVDIFAISFPAQLITYIFSVVVFFIQIIWVALANQSIRKEQE